VLTQHPTLLIGPSDWDETRAPKAEFDRRIAALWDACPNAQRAIVFGSAANHAELAYFTHFVPKLEPGIALLTRAGDHKLLFGGGPNMIGAMKPLTFIRDMAPLGALAKLVSGWQAPLLIGGGYMTSVLRRTIDEATGHTAHDATAQVWHMMRRKSPSELAAIGDACAILKEVLAAIRASVSVGHFTRTSVLAGERAAIDSGAQDVRILFSRDGGRTLRPLDGPYDGYVDPLQIYAAVRKHNYWAEGFACISKESQPPTALAALLLDNALAAIRPGVAFAQLAKVMALSAPYRTHPVTQAEAVSPIGLSLHAPAASAATAFEAGEVYSVRVGLTDHADRHAIVSAMIAVRGGANDILWRSNIA
jgi:hypothetical protein